MTLRFSDDGWHMLMERGLLPESLTSELDAHEDEMSHGAAPLFASATDRPISLYLPEHYEHSYAYPLIVWLHGDGGTEDDTQLLMPMISERNYVGLGIRGDQRHGEWFGWSDTTEAAETLRDDLSQTISELRRFHNLHTERVYLAGFDSGASMALRLLLEKPEWFAGAAMLGGRMPTMRNPLSQFSRLRKKRLLVCAGERDRQIDSDQTVNMVRLMHAAGVQTQAKAFDADHQISLEMLSKLNHWVMEGVCPTTNSLAQ